MIRHHIALGHWVEQQVLADARFELAAPSRFALTCLRLKGVGNEGNKALLQAVNDTGACVEGGGKDLGSGTGGPRVCMSAASSRQHTPHEPPPTGSTFMVGTELEGAFIIRFAIGASHTQLKHVKAAWQLLQAHADAVLAEHSRGGQKAPSEAK
jgi:tyrosine decarboxylase